MALHEAGYGLVRRAVLDLQEGQGRASETARQDTTVGYPVVEMGRYYDGFYHKASPDGARSRFDLGHRGSIDQERPFYSDPGEYLGRKVGRYLYQVNWKLTLTLTLGLVRGRWSFYPEVG